MAVLPYDLTEEERLRLEQEASESGAGSNQPAPGTDGGSDLPAPPSNLSPQASGRSSWVDVGSYLDANKEQSLGLAQNVAGGLATQAQGLRTDVDTAADKFRGTVDENTIRVDDDRLGRASADPLAYTQNQEDVDAFYKMRDASYRGPESFQSADDYMGLVGKIGEASERAKGVDTEAGREALLASQMTNPTKGQTSLNQLLIGANPEARSTLSAAAQPFSELNSYLDTAAGGAADYAKTAKQTTANTKAAAQAAMEGTRGRLDTELNDRLGQFKSDAVTKSEAARDRLSQYRDIAADDFTDEELSILGITREQAKEMGDLGYTLKNAGNWETTENTPDGQLNYWWEYGSPDFYNVDFDPTRFGTMQSPDAQITRANMANQEDYSRIAALEQLMGSPSGVLNPNDIGLAGTASHDLYDFRGDEALGGSKELLNAKDRDRASTLANSFSTPPPGAYGSDQQLEYMAKQMKPFFDAVMTGQTKYHNSNPEANARGLSLIRAFARLGFYDIPENSVIDDPGKRV